MDIRPRVLAVRHGNRRRRASWCADSCTPFDLRGAMNCLHCGAGAKVRLVAHYDQDVRSVYACYACRARLERGLRAERVRGRVPNYVSEHYLVADCYDDLVCDCAGFPHADHCPLATNWFDLD